MSFRKRISLVLLLGLGSLFTITLWGNFGACRWMVDADNSVTRAYASPRSFGPSAYPDGDFVVAVEGPEGLRKALIKYLQRELPKTASGDSRVVVISDASSFAPGESLSEDSNMLYVSISAGLQWTPLFARFTDAVMVKFNNGYVPGWAGFLDGPVEIAAGALRIKGQYSAAGTGFGLVGRPYVDAYHAELIGDFVTKTITDTYSQIREAAAKPVND